MKNRLHLYLITWNCARIPSVTSPFTEHILAGIPDGSPAPDLLVLALQEAAPISYAFLGGKYLDPYINTYVTAVQNATRTVLGVGYTLVGSNHVGMTMVLVFVRDVSLGKVKSVEYGGVGCGLWDMGNKAGVGVKIGYEVAEGEGWAGEGDDDWMDTGIVELNFIGLHLAPHEWLVRRRNQDWEAIVRGLVFERKERNHAEQEDSQRPLLDGDTELEDTVTDTTDVGIYSPGAHTFVMGDFNYRTASTRPTEWDRVLFPQPKDSLDDTTHISKLFEEDQCHQERLSGHTLHGFAEAEITFPPTYKYKIRKGKDYDSNRWEWARHRWPSWTDRIFYLPLYSAHPSTSQDEIVVHSYTSIPQIMDSDHKPVVCYLSIPAQPLPVRQDASGATADASRKKDFRSNPPFPVNTDWKERRAAARIREVAVGAAAFFTTTTTGLGILIGVLGGVFGMWWLLAG